METKTTLLELKKFTDYLDKNYLDPTHEEYTRLLEEDGDIYTDIRDPAPPGFSDELRKLHYYYCTLNSVMENAISSIHGHTMRAYAYYNDQLVTVYDLIFMYENLRDKESDEAMELRKFLDYDMSGMEIVTSVYYQANSYLDGAYDKWMQLQI